MNRDSKYYPLLAHLRHSGQDEVTLTLNQIEHLIGYKLPASARSARGWWSNRSGGGLQAQAWMDAGYHVVGIDLAQARITFRKPARKYTVRREGGTVLWDADSIKALRQHMAMNQAQLAEELGVRQQTVSEWEVGLYVPSRATRKHLTLVAERAGFTFGK